MFQIVSMRRSVESGLPRRDFIKLAGLAGVGLTTSARLLKTASAAENQKSGPQPESKADYTVRIGTGLIDLAPNQIVSTSLYNGQFPGPLLRFKEGESVTVDIFNDTDTPEQLHWHGQMIPVDVDGAAEEGTPYIPARGMRRLHFTPRPAGFRFYHTHLTPRHNLNLGQYTGQVGPVLH
jgi:FtsP/CotA-like multicopper oxidase with cupredoxin domain